MPSSKSGRTLTELAAAVLPHPQAVTPTPGEYYRGSQPDGGMLFSQRADAPLIAPLQDGRPLTTTVLASAGCANPEDRLHEAFSVAVAPDAITVRSAGPRGRIYAAGLVGQLFRLAGPSPLPAGTITDWPTLGDRGYMVDVSRNRVPTRDTLADLVDYLTMLRFNHLELYFEHVFAYEGHETVWQDTGVVRPDDIRWLQQKCDARAIELVPNQNSFGHLAGWLCHDAYRHLAEAPNGFLDPWGTHRPDPFSLSPAVPEVDQFLARLYDQLLPLFRSRRINVGLDETFDLGQGRSSNRILALAKENGESTADATGRVYLDMLLRVHALVSERGRHMLFWGDIVQNHPHLVAKLPRGVTAIEWGYEADHDFEGRCGRLRAAGVPYLTAPGTALWNSVGGRLHTADANISAAVSAARAGGTGVLLTDWGDNDHIPPPILARPAIALAGARAWNGDHPVTIDGVLAWTSRFQLADPIDAPLILALRTVALLDHLAGAPAVHNASPLGVALFTFGVPIHAPVLAHLTEDTINAYEELLTGAGGRLAGPPSDSAQEWSRALRFALDLGLFAVDLLRLHRSALGHAVPAGSADRARARYHTLDRHLAEDWVRGYRPGGLADSRDRLARPLRHLGLLPPATTPLSV